MESNNPAILELIARYKAHLRKHGLADERYKWELLQEFGGRPRIDAPSIKEEVLGIKFKNLIFQRAWMVLRHIAQDRPEELRDILRRLIDESQPIQSRITGYIREMQTLYAVLVPDWAESHHQDERTAGVILAFHSPDKYPFYKSTVYGKLCKVLGIKPKQKGEKFSHFQQLVNETVLPVLRADPELEALYRSKLSANLFQDPGRYLLLQDMLYITLEKEPTPLVTGEVEQVWIFQCNPALYDIVGAMQAGVLDSWSINTYKDKIKEGDKFILWVTGADGGCFGLGEIASEVKNTNSQADRKFWRSASIQESFDGVEIEFTDDWHDRPIRKDLIVKDDRFQAFKGGSQGTVHKATIAEFEALRDLAMKTPPSTFPLNTILYGPPGTGKTYNTCNQALKALQCDTSKMTRETMRARFHDFRMEGRIAFVTFHQSMAYEDFVEGIKPQEPEGEKPLYYATVPGIFKRISEVALKNYHDSQRKVGVTALTFEAAIERLSSEWELDNNILFPLRTKGYDFKILAFDPQSICIQIKSESRHWLKLKTLKAIYEQRKELNFLAGTGIYYRSVLDRLLTYPPEAAAAPPLLPYVLIIDEINRGNVSQIFGELITLLEEDKRIGRPEAITVKLPYSPEDDFAVPPNLYIIGTMNTADRSVEALDTALRRRFEFVEMPPRPEILLQNPDLPHSPHSNDWLIVNDFRLCDILHTLNLRIEKLLDRDHCIGHAYFMGVDNLDKLKSAFQHKIIPLLQEYFYGDYAKIGLVLGKGFVHLANEGKENGDDLFADFSNDHRHELAQRKVWHLADVGTMHADAFLDALKAMKIKTFPGAPSSTKSETTDSKNTENAPAA